MINYVLIIAIVAFAAASMVLGTPSAESALLLCFTLVGVLALLPKLILRHRAMLLRVFQVLCAGLIIFGWFVVMDSGEETMTADSIALSVTFITVGAFGLLTLGLPTALVEHRVTHPVTVQHVAAHPQHPQHPQQPQTPLARATAQAQAQHGSGEVDPSVLFSKLDSVLRDTDDPNYMGLGAGAPPVAPGFTADEDPTTHFTKDELNQIRQYAGKLQTTSDDEDPTTLFSKNELDEIRQYAERLHEAKRAGLSGPLPEVEE